MRVEFWRKNRSDSEPYDLALSAEMDAVPRPGDQVRIGRESLTAYGVLWRPDLPCVIVILKTPSEFALSYWTDLAFGAEPIDPVPGTDTAS